MDWHPHEEQEFRHRLVVTKVISLSSIWYDIKLSGSLYYQYHPWCKTRCYRIILYDQIIYMYVLVNTICKEMYTSMLLNQFTETFCKLFTPLLMSCKETLVMHMESGWSYLFLYFSELRTVYSKSIHLSFHICIALHAKRMAYIVTNRDRACTIFFVRLSSDKEMMVTI